MEFFFHCQFAMRQSLSIDLCRDTIFNSPGMTLDSYVKGSDNMIYREWAWKAWPWAQMSGLVVASMGAYV